MKQRPEVEISLGRLRGADRGDVHAFLGIPYAAPPLGALRFEAPRAPEAWTGVRDATAFGPAPFQAIDPLSLKLGLLAEHPLAEDCLSVNVFAPARAAAAPRPVMVWIHGGAFASGTAAGPAYDGAPLAAEGDVVVVTLNYRVGALGFLARGTPNRGLLDQVAALRFVRDEIARFGGDPANVTLFGESAGAGSIAALLAMPAARGLFHQAILQSAAPEGVLSVAEADERAALFAGALGVEPGDLQALVDAAPEALVDAQAKCQEPGPRRIGMFFAPVVDGEILPDTPLARVAAGAAREVPLIVGTTANEMQLYHLLEGMPGLPDAVIPHLVAPRLPGPEDAALERASALTALYLGDDCPLEGRDRFFAVETDASLFVPATRLAEGHARHTPRTWMYRFCWPSPLADGRLGACHALDVPFVLGTGERVPEFAGSGAAAERVGRAMRSAWVAFARSGSPETAEVGEWPCYDASRRATLFIDDPCRLVERPDEVRRRAWAVARGEADPEPSRRNGGSS